MLCSSGCATFCVVNPNYKNDTLNATITLNGLPALKILHVNLLTYFMLVKDYFRHLRQRLVDI